MNRRRRLKSSSKPSVQLHLLVFEFPLPSRCVI
uniref:Uncharacterized protein n=1 Tax=Medicago truncatula TaxID=3880 RepID=I3ST07_MEDTR|nr:unknown [Medicago truncatula]